MSEAYQIIYEPLVINPANSISDEGRKAVMRLVEYAENLSEQRLELLSQMNETMISLQMAALNLGLDHNIIAEASLNELAKLIQKETRE